MAGALTRLALAAAGAPTEGDDQASQPGARAARQYARPAARAARPARHREGGTNMGCAVARMSNSDGGMLVLTLVGTSSQVPVSQPSCGTKKKCKKSMRPEFIVMTVSSVPKVFVTVTYGAGSGRQPWGKASAAREDQPRNHWWARDIRLLPARTGAVFPLTTLGPSVVSHASLAGDSYTMLSKRMSGAIPHDPARVVRHTAADVRSGRPERQSSRQA